MNAAVSTAKWPDVDAPLLAVDELVVDYPIKGVGRGARVSAVAGVTLSVRSGETLALVGESGCGKSTLGRAMTMLTPPTSGSVTFVGQELTSMGDRDLRRLRRRLQIIFQDPISSLNPFREVRDIVSEGLQITGAERPWDARITEMMTSVGLDSDEIGGRRPHQLSGGQCQRVAIARALMLEPALIVCDEPVSALDVSVQAQILNLLADVRDERQLTLVFISHDLAVVRQVSDRVAVMYLGRLCEVAPSSQLYERPAHPYTRALLQAVPSPDPRARRATVDLHGEIPSPLTPPSGCRFRTRCPLASHRCAEETPTLVEIAPDHLVACHHPLGATDDAL